MKREKDSMGTVEVPGNVLFGASTQRAVLNFPISDLRFSRAFIRALGAIKLSAAQANQDLGLLARDLARAIQSASKEVMEGRWDEEFVVDIFQTGSGTSTNMNANEVIASRAEKLLKPRRKIHPNDEVNKAQSSNDVIPSAIHVAASMELRSALLPALDFLADALKKKSSEFSKTIKAGRTHLQDATPLTLGQEFSGYEAQIRNSRERIERVFPFLLELALGGTAVGTGLNTHPRFAKVAIEHLNKLTKMSFKEARNHFEAQGSRDAIVALSGELKTLACALIKIANDIRLLASGPRCGLAELRLPEVQPGSSIMPAKVNPVICESVIMVGAQVIGNDACVSFCGATGQFELNAMLPVMAYNILQSIEILANGARNFAEKCIAGIQADEERCRDYAEKSLATCTALARNIGYDRAAQIAKIALTENKTVREVAKKLSGLTDRELEKVLNLEGMTKPGL
jgi:fumarate hydratase, class II